MGRGLGGNGEIRIQTGTSPIGRDTGTATSEGRAAVTNETSAGDISGGKTDGAAGRTAFTDDRAGTTD